MCITSASSTVTGYIQSRRPSSAASQLQAAGVLAGKAICISLVRQSLSPSFPPPVPPRCMAAARAFLMGQPAGAIVMAKVQMRPSSEAFFDSFFIVAELLFQQTHMVHQFTNKTKGP